MVNLFLGAHTMHGMYVLMYNRKLKKNFGIKLLLKTFNSGKQDPGKDIGGQIWPVFSLYNAFC